MARVIGAWALCIGLVFAAPEKAAAPDRTILVLGDSLSAAYGIEPGQGWVALLESRLRREGYAYRVVNASISGETTGGGLERLPRALRLHEPSIVIVELGANDGLRGLPVAVAQANLTKIVTLSRQAGAQVLLLGVRIPPNYGPRYTAAFTRMFSDIASRDRLAFVPFFLESIALDTNQFLGDGLHPNAQAQPALLDTVWPRLAPLLKKR